MPLEFGVYVVSTPLAASRWTHEASTASKRDGCGRTRRADGVGGSATHSLVKRRRGLTDAAAAHLAQCTKLLVMGNLLLDAWKLTIFDGN